MTVRELLARVSSRELSEWRVYAQMEPFGSLRADYRAGVLAALTANINRGEDAETVAPDDFFPELKEPEPEETPEERSARLLGMVELLNVAFGGEDKRE